MFAILQRYMSEPYCRYMILSTNSQGVFKKKYLSLRGRRVLQVLPSLNVGGVEVGTVQMAKALLDVGAEAHVVSAGGKFERELEALGARLHTLPLTSKSPIQLVANARRLRKIVQSEGIDLVHVRSRAPAWSVYWALKDKATPWLATFHGTYNFKSSAKKFYNSVMVRGCRVIAISNFIKDHILMHYSDYVRADQLRVIHRGVDLMRFSPEHMDKSDGDQLRESFGIPLDAPLIVMPGRLTPWKGQRVLIEALAALKKLECYGLIVGPSKGKMKYKESLQSLIHAHGLEGRIFLSEGVLNVPSLYGAADLIVHASLEPEAFGRTLIEAQASGKVVVASKEGAPIEIIEDTVTGFLVPPGDVPNLAHMIEHYFNLPESTQKRMEFAARARAQSYFSEALMCDKTLSVYEEILEGRTFDA